VDVRIIAATNRDLEAAVRESRFRDDLYYRLNVFAIKIPPLRERAEDIPQLTESFVKEFAKALGKRIDAVEKGSIDALRLYPWPGNVRELRNAVERAVIVSNGPRLKIDTPKSSANSTNIGLTMKNNEREHLRRVLEMTGWRIRGKDGAAEILDLKPTTLESRLTKLNLLRKAKTN
jgi:transcriptional regulator with GAF, ATPase, and Fis domain